MLRYHLKRCASSLWSLWLRIFFEILDLKPLLPDSLKFTIFRVVNICVFSSEGLSVPKISTVSNLSLNLLNPRHDHCTLKFPDVVGLSNAQILLISEPIASPIHSRRSSRNLPLDNRTPGKRGREGKGRKPTVRDKRAYLQPRSYTPLASIIR